MMLNIQIIILWGISKSFWKWKELLEWLFPGITGPYSDKLKGSGTEVAKLA